MCVREIEKENSGVLVILYMYVLGWSCSKCSITTETVSLTRKAEKICMVCSPPLSVWVLEERRERNREGENEREGEPTIFIEREERSGEPRERPALYMHISLSIALYFSHAPLIFPLTLLLALKPPLS